MGQLENFREHFSESSIFALAEVFETAKGTDNKEKIKELELQVRSVLQQELTCGLTTWEISSKGNNHVIVSSDLCAFVNIYGIRFLFENPLLFDGELRILNFHWIEDDNIVVFDMHYIVHDEWQKCICHFENTDFFVYFTPIVKDERRLHNNNIIDDSLFGEQW